MGSILLQLKSPIKPLPDLESIARLGYFPIKIVLRSGTSFDKSGKYVNTESGADIVQMRNVNINIYLF